jgi:Flp pilus assembly pilin Flp
MINVSRKIASPAQAASGLLRRFRRDEGGVAAVEFALIAPILIVTYLGILEVSQGFQASRKLSLFARTAADLTSQGPKDPAPSTDPIPASEVTDIAEAAKWIMAPFPIETGQIRLTISGVMFKMVSGSLKAYTDWSVTFSGARRPCQELGLVANNSPASPLTIPVGLAQDGATVIVADAAYDYKPLLGGNFRSFNGGATSQVELKQTAYMRPRNTSRVRIASTTPNAQLCGFSFP